MTRHEQQTINLYDGGLIGTVTVQSRTPLDVTGRRLERVLLTRYGRRATAVGVIGACRPCK